MVLSRRGFAFSGFQFGEYQALDFVAENEVGKANSPRSEPAAFGGLRRTGMVAIPAVDICQGLHLLEE